jgi:hypothetical protein
LITAQEVAGLNPAAVTNKKEKSKNNQARLKLFLGFSFFQSGALSGCCEAKSSRGH